MRKRIFWGAVPFALLAAGCGSNESKHSNQSVALSDRSVEPGAVPTNPSSFDMMEDPVKRRKAFQDILVANGHACGTATEAILKAGADGTDLWRVTCTDSGIWLVTFGADTSKTAVSCRQSPGECEAAWKSAESQPKIY